MRVFIVGATGVLGRALLPLLWEQGHTVRALVRDRATLPVADDIEALRGDLLDASIAATLPEMLAGCDAAIHIATAIPRNPTAPDAWRANTRLRTEGTRRLLDGALAAGVPRYIQQSIVMAYPDGGDRWLDESTPLDNSPARAALVAPLIAMEGMIRKVPAAQLQWCILRGGTFVGPGTAQDDQVVWLRKKMVAIPGDGRNFISPVHVADMAAAVAAALMRASGATTFNIVDTPLRYSEYVDGLADRLGVRHPPRVAGLPTSPSYRCSNQAAREALGWAPTHSIWPNLDPQGANARAS